MAKKTKRRTRKGHPWYWKARDYWVHPKQAGKAPIPLLHNGDYVRGKDNRALAEKVWLDSRALSNAADVRDDNAVWTILELYLQNAKNRRVSQKTLDDYTEWFRSFSDSIPPQMTVKELRAHHIENWWKEEWSDSFRNLIGSAFKAAFNWAATSTKGDIITRNPLGGWELPMMQARSSDCVISQEEFDGLISLVHSERIRDILIVLWETGTRPVNLRRATAENLVIDNDGQRLVFKKHKAVKKTGKELEVELPPGPAQEIIAKLVGRHPTGNLFRRPRGGAWTAQNLASDIAHYAKLAGLEGRYTPYSNRHCMANRIINAGGSKGDAACVLGNTERIIERWYDHAQPARRRNILATIKPKTRDESAGSKTSSAGATEGGGEPVQR
jgi:integrase